MAVGTQSAAQRAALHRRIKRADDELEKLAVVSHINALKFMG